MKELINQPWGLIDVLKKLVEATDILLHKKDYDGHGWEEIEICYSRGKEIINYLEAGLKKQLELTDEEIEAIEFIAKEPDCNEYWRKNVKQFCSSEGEADDNSCELSNEWQQQFEIAIKFLQKWVGDYKKI